MWTTYLFAIGAPDDVIHVVLRRGVQQALEGLVLGDARHMKHTGDTVVDLLLQSRLDLLGATGLLDSDETAGINTDTLEVRIVVLLAGAVVAKLDDDFVVGLVPSAIDSTTVNQAENIGDGSSLGKVLEGDPAVRGLDLNRVLARRVVLAKGAQELLRGGDATVDRPGGLLDRTEWSRLRIGTAWSDIEGKSSVLGGLSLANIRRSLS